MPNSLIAQKRKNFIIYLLSIFLLNLPLFIPSVMAHEVVKEEWVTTYDSPLGGSDTVTAMTIDNGGNAYVTGTSDGDFSTVKYDSQGAQLWVARYDSGGVDSPTDLAVDTEGNVYVTGYFTGTSAYGYVTIKYDSQGNQLWLDRYEIYSYERLSFLAIDSKGNVYVTATRHEYLDVGGVFTETVTIKYDLLGNKQWIARYGMRSVSDIAVDSNDNIYLTGWVPNSNPDHYEDYCTIKYDPDGNQLWVATYDGGIGDYPSTLVIDANNNIYVTGYSMYGPIPAGYATIKYDSEGNQLWVGRYKPAYSACGHVCMATALAVDKRGNVYVTGGARYDHGNHINIIKYDYAGNELWTTRYQATPYIGRVQPASLVVDSAGDLYVSGYIYDYSVDPKPSLIIIKYSSDGKMLWEDPIPNANKSPTKLAVDTSGSVYMGGTVNDNYNIIKYSPSGDKIWKVTYDDPMGGNDFPTDLVLDSRGNIYVTGYSSSNSSASDSATIKYNPQGQRVWVAKYDKSGVGKDKAQAIAIDHQDNIYVTGSSYNVDTSSYDITTVKYDSEENELWVARDDGGFELYGYYYNLREQAYKVAIDNSGNVYVTGISTGWCSGVIGERCLYILTSKHDPGGNQLWIKRYGGGIINPPASDVQSMTLAIDSMGNVYIGVLWRVGSPTIIKYDPAGNQLWKINIGYAGYGGDIALDNSEYLIVTGSNGTAKYDKDGRQLWTAEFGGRSLKIDSSDNVYVLTDGYGYVIKYDKDGNEIWQRPGKGEFGDYGGSNRSMTLDRNGNAYVSTDYGSDYTTIKFDTEGNRLWVVRYNGGGPDSPTALAVDTYGNIYVGGSSGLAGRGSDITIIKYSQINDNHPPYIPAIPQPSHGATGIAINTTLIWAGADPDAGDTVTYNIYFGKIIGQPEVFIPSHSTTSYDPVTLNYSSTYYWQIVAFDNHGAFTVGPVWSFTTLSLPNQTPIAKAGPDQVAAIGNSVTLDASGSSDPDRNTLSYSWTLVSKPEGSDISLSDTSSPNISFTPDKDGLYNFQLIVNDGKAQSSPDYVTVRALGQENKIIVATNKTQYKPGDTLELYIWVGNAATASELTADVFLGFGLPDGSLYCFDSSLNLKFADPTDPRSFIPIGRAVTLSPSFVFPGAAAMDADSDGNGKLDSHRLFSVTLPKELPEGEYYAFAALAEPGTTHAGSPQLLSPISLAYFSFTR